VPTRSVIVFLTGLEPVEVDGSVELVCDRLGEARERGAYARLGSNGSVICVNAHAVAYVYPQDDSRPARGKGFHFGRA
jgi:hypothetical protein